MKNIGAFLIVSVVLFACVPAKKYNELLEREQKCSVELEQHKLNSINNEGRAKDLQARYDALLLDAGRLKADTNSLGEKLRFLNMQYDKLVQQTDLLERSFDKYRLTGAMDAAGLSAQIEAKNIELQRREDELMELEKELRQKEVTLQEREQRVFELEEMIRRQEEAANQLKARVAKALVGFENKGLSVVQKDGKIYVSMEAKLLFASGSTAVESEGKAALVELAKVLQDEKDLEIIVEGHTDTDKLNASTHPKSNWELSVLRATSVIQILLSESTMDPKQLVAAGRSEFHPVDLNDKAKNRRIEIIISPNLNELYEIISKS